MTSAFSHPCVFRTSRLAAQVLSWGLALVAALAVGILASLPVVSSVSFDPHESSIVLGSQNAVGQTLAQSGVQHATEPASIVGLALIVAERLLIAAVYPGEKCLTRFIVPTNSDESRI